MNFKSNTIYSLSFLPRAIAYIAVSVALIISYNFIKDYNKEMIIHINDYIISTYLGVIILVSLILFWVVVVINNIFVAVINKFRNLKKSYITNKVFAAEEGLLDASILAALKDNKTAKMAVEAIDQEYLNSPHKDYLNLLKAQLDNDNLPVHICYHLIKHPRLKFLAAKKLAEVEFKLGNLEKAFEWAELYYSHNTKDYKNIYLLCEILASKQDWKSLDEVISKLHTVDESNEKAKLSKFYLKAAHIKLQTGLQDKALKYCEKALLINPIDYKSAELFCEIASSAQKYDLINSILLDIFRTNPNFEIFLLLRKFSNYRPLELFELLTQNIEPKLYLGLFIAIATVLELPEKQAEIILKLE